jgi:hypothetical protein
MPPQMETRAIGGFWNPRPTSNVAAEVPAHVAIVARFGGSRETQNQREWPTSPCASVPVSLQVCLTHESQPELDAGQT